MLKKKKNPLYSNLILNKLSCHHLSFHRVEHFFVLNVKCGGGGGGSGSCPVHNGLNKIQLKTEIFLYKSKGLGFRHIIFLIK
jgi:hypothetical protein